MAELLTKRPQNITEYPNSFMRQGAFPLEAYSLFFDTVEEGVVTQTAYNAAKDYAQNNPLAYVGQELAVIEPVTVGDKETTKVTIYTIQDAEGNLAQVGVEYDDTDVRTLISNLDEKIGTIPDDSGVTNIVDYVNKKTEGIASEGHSHSISDVTGLQSALDGKAAVDHNHDDKYAGKDHNHDDEYAAKDHDHSEYVVTVDTTTTTENGVLKHYIFKQGNTELAHIDIPKDLVVQSGEVVDLTEGEVEGYEAGKYIKLTIANQTAPLYIAVTDLVDVYTAEANAAQVQIAISASNEISATIVAKSITTAELSDELVALINGKASGDHDHDGAYAPIDHDHAIDDVTGLSDQLQAITELVNGKAASDHNHDDDYAAKTHTHTISEVAELEDQLGALSELINGKAAVDHDHAIADVTGLETALAGKADSGHNHDDAYAAKEHTHDQYLVQDDIANFVTKDGDKVLSANDFTDALKTKLEGIETGAQVNKIDSIKVGEADAVKEKSVKFSSKFFAIKNDEIELAEGIIFDAGSVTDIEVEE